MNSCYKSILALFLLICFGCCGTSPCSPPPTASSVPYEYKHPEFTPQSLSWIREGMSVEELERIFGYPDRSHERKVGLTKFLIYEYDMAKNPHYSHQFDVTNTFYFGVDQSPPYLKKWEVEYVHTRPYAAAPGRVE